MINDDDCWFNNVGELFEKLISRGIDPIQWVRDGSDLSVFDEQDGMQLLDEWTDERCQAFWGAGYMQALSNNTGYGCVEIVRSYMHERSKCESTEDS